MREESSYDAVPCSYLEIPRPDLEHSRDDVDFGRGFYTTFFYEQAEKWCGKFKRRGKDGFISCYSFDDIGGVANDKVFNTVELFVDGLIGKEEALKRLRFEEPNIQVCLGTTKSLSHLRFEGSTKL